MILAEYAITNEWEFRIWVSEAHLASIFFWEGISTVVDGQLAFWAISCAEENAREKGSSRMPSGCRWRRYSKPVFGPSLSHSHLFLLIYITEKRHWTNVRILTMLGGGVWTKENWAMTDGESMKEIRIDVELSVSRTARLSLTDARSLPGHQPRVKLPRPIAATDYRHDCMSKKIRVYTMQYFEWM